MENLISGGLVKKVHVVESSTFIHHPLCIDVLGNEGNAVVVPWPTVEDIEKVKSRPDLKGAAAVEASNQFKYYLKQAKEKKLSLREGVKTRTGGWVAVDYSGVYNGKDTKDLPKGFDPCASVGNRVIYTGLKWKSRCPDNIPVKLISRKITLLLQAEALGLEAEDYEHDTVLDSLDDLYTGTRDIRIDFAKTNFPNEIYRDHFVSEAMVFNAVGKLELYPNQCCTFIGEDRTKFLTIYKRAEKIFRHVEWPQKKKGFVPINIPQAYAYALLTDPGIHIVTVVGPGGGGKTLVTLHAGADQLDKPFLELLAYRPIVEMGGRSLGFYKGTMEEKFQPWTEPIFDNVGLVEMSMTNRAMAKELVEHRLKMQPLIHVRGRSIHGRFIFVDDAQNLTPHEAKTICTRPAAKSKLVMLGDPDPLQIDEPFLTPLSNGLVYTVQKMKGSEIFGHIILPEPVRSELAKEAAMRM
ncbi:hypothetical protein A2662_02145 [Candidatus Giovannonibacteria bacterium RIFCSPHIGHO2_01_FULL_45_33]|uniref:PhoH-like protein domain-containing protein n=1 Tax=Candidatus Giovannonibacteria bacterium RIFCSPLOWO2_01_FULL_45_34 TaxID=1798351 RepID=A0A1F5X1X1_9BACT|nr:MAG: hypothetical protein A2662_02145 [Candidatus Giovannonibacteria bacterium RIFCSPHIGHO2_01_FULL_45_33]OGF70779.1 MAG: hypothetical protein A3C73_02705 [Candidatus Giovannonibacteria bacterium RIFCSPHIGHO2_02_FULL_44_11]OGF81896.1 MAG: hypothetical protein A2930_00265 [Candidatus Giovannonibacteria bacterium RIFCSPLOWO2_01_FULL_45_34]